MAKHSGMKRVFPVLFLFLSQALLSQERIEDVYRDVFLRAGKEHKSVIFIFSHENCGWCRVFDRYHELPEVKKILEKNYLIEIIDITDSESNKKLWEQYKYIGVPAWIIYRSDQELISDGKKEDGEQVGYPLEPDGMDVYISAIRNSSRRISEKQLQVLREKIVYCDKHY